MGTTVNFEEYGDDYLGIALGLASTEERARAMAGYQDFLAQASKPRRTLGPEAQRARNMAKALGGQALLGSQKQKEWAEKIRAEKLAQLTAEQGKLVVDPSGLLRHSQFWISQRMTSADAIAAFIAEQKTLLAAHGAATAAGDTKQSSSLAVTYNELTAKWGF